MVYQKTLELRMKILEYIREYEQAHGFLPSYRDIQRGLHISGPSNVKYHLDQMRKLKLIDWQAGTGRSVHLVPADEAPRKTAPAGSKQGKTAAYVNFLANFHTAKSRPAMTIPILGTTFGGPTQMSFPDDAPVYVDPDNRLNISKDMLPHGVKPEELFALYVSGDSMIEAGIHDGDLIIVKRAATAHAGEMVVAYLDDRNETTLKYFHPENDKIVLKPANREVKDIVIDKEQAKCLRILGIGIRAVRVA